MSHPKITSIGISKPHPTQEGDGSRTIHFVNADGERFWVQFDFATRQGIAYMCEAEPEAPVIPVCADTPGSRNLSPQTRQLRPTDHAHGRGVASALEKLRG